LFGKVNAGLKFASMLLSQTPEYAVAGYESGGIIPAPLTSLFEMIQSKGVFLVLSVCCFVVLLMGE
jgi:hypothetical protein